MKRNGMRWGVLLLLCGACVVRAAVARAQIEIVAVGGEPAPDGNGTFSSFGTPSMNASGHVAFMATLDGTAAGNNDHSGIFLGTAAPGSLRVIVRQGTASPTGNGNFDAFDSRSDPILNDAGQPVFAAGLFGTFGGARDAGGVFRTDASSGALTEILAQGQAAPGSGTFNSVFNTLFTNTLAFNEMGQVAFSALGGIFTTSGSTVTEIARAPHPGPGDFGNYTLISPPALNDAGEVAFMASGVSRTGGGSFGILRSDASGTVTTVARTGDPAPDGNGTFGMNAEGPLPFSNPAINNHGDVAFFATLTGTSGASADDEGIFASTHSGTSPDALTAIVRRGQAAPDGNGRFLDLYGHGDNIALDDTRRAAFVATLTATAGGASDSTGLFRGDGTILTQIVRTGDLAPHGSRINSLGEPALNNAGQVAFVAGLVPASGFSTQYALLAYDDRLGLREAARTGDALLGSKIEFVSPTIVFQPSVTHTGRKRGGLNDDAQVVFEFDLDDGRQGLAVANPLSTSPTATPTATPTPHAAATPTPTITPRIRPTVVTAVCVGDCDGSGDVRINELITVTDIALSPAPPPSPTPPNRRSQSEGCSRGIPSGAPVDVSLVLQAVNDALTGCPTPGTK